MGIKFLTVALLFLLTALWVGCMTQQLMPVTPTPLLKANAGSPTAGPFPTYTPAPTAEPLATPTPNPTAVPTTAVPTTAVPTTAIPTETTKTFAEVEAEVMGTKPAQPTAVPPPPPTMRGYCHLKDPGERGSSEFCILRMKQGIDLYSLKKNGGQWEATCDKRYKNRLKFKVDGGKATNENGLLETLLSSNVGYHKIQIWDPAGGSYSGWSQPLEVRLIK